MNDTFMIYERPFKLLKLKFLSNLSKTKAMLFSTYMFIKIVINFYNHALCLNSLNKLCIIRIKRLFKLL